MQLTAEDFATFHQAVHERKPFKWQTRLLREVIEQRRWPRVLDLPTGSGKTTCVDIALFALALDATEGPEKRWCPRRIAMIVDRRVVVDQAAERGRKLLRALIDQDAVAVVREVADRLRGLSYAAEEPIGVFTLRGGIPKDDSWARTPDQPLILASTVDQLGSRLFMQGYGVSDRMKPIHAGLLANDVLILLDEVHLSNAFAESLEQLTRLRQRFDGSSPLARRFHVAFLSATPGDRSESTFRLSEDEKADGPLAERLRAPKPTRVFEVADRTEVERQCVAEATALIKTHDVVAVVVNRVASAAAIVQQLRAALVDQVDIKLITGRMRPLDRDDVLRDLGPRIMAGRDRMQVQRKLIVVGTQSIEAGADFDFDALVTEAASLDALRQRFGRVDRLGSYMKAVGVIVSDKSNKDDPVYRLAASKTVSWLKNIRTKKREAIDFGVLALPVPAGDELNDLLAPKEQAPTLLPAYLDLWMQSSPRPSVVPDVSLWLHGDRSGPADIQMVWRIDVTEEDLRKAQTKEGDRLRLIAIVASIIPSSLEAMQVPFAAARRWLKGDQVGDIADVEGTPTDGDQQGDGGNLAFCWMGNDSEVISGDGLRPGDTIILPSSRGGIRDSCFAPESRDPVPDLAEQAALFGRARPLLRLHPKVLATLGPDVPTDDLDETRAFLGDLADSLSGWRKVWLEALAKSKRHFSVDADESWIVLQGNRLSRDAVRILRDNADGVEDGADLTTDPEESCHTGRAVTLSDHSRNVGHLAREYARILGLPREVVEDLAMAGWLHDIGKADRRFQLLLRGGSEIDSFKDGTPWAKSGMAPGAKAEHRLAHKRSGYPRGARHEVQSVAMIQNHIGVLKEKLTDTDLVLHLVASHHGYCRPFAPVFVDAAPVHVTLHHESAAFGVVDFHETPSDHGLYKLDAPLADRFWRLVERYGWLELCAFEAVLRLADHRASEREQKADSGS